MRAETRPLLFACRLCRRRVKCFVGLSNTRGPAEANQVQARTGSKRRIC